MSKRPKPKRANPKKRGLRGERLVITGDPQAALEKFLRDQKPAKDRAES